MDVIQIENGKLSLQGNVAQKLSKCGFNQNALRPYFGDDNKAYITVNGKAVRIDNATLRKDEWKVYDAAVIKSAQTRLRGIADLQSRGLVYNIPNGLGKTVLEWEDQGDINEAEVNMQGVARGNNDRPNWDINYLPLPIIHKDFQIDARALEASRTTGQPLDTTMAELAARKVAEKAEDFLFNGSGTYTYGGGTIYGYKDFTHRNTYAINNNWDDSSAVTGTQILLDVVGMKAMSIADRNFGPWVLYIPTNFETRLDEDFKSNSDKSIRTRLLEIDGLEDIRISDTLTSDNVILVQMTSDNVRLVQGMPITTLQWDSEGGMVHHFKVMTIMVPHLRADQSNRCGIVHGS